MAEPRNPSLFEGEKILIRKITGKTLISTYIPDTSYCNTLLFILKITDKSYSYPALTGILNSSLIGWYFRKKFQITDNDTFPQIMIRDILEFPIPTINEKTNEELSGLVNQIIKLNEELKNQKLPHRIEQLKSQFEHIDSKIDNYVFKLYEINNVELNVIKNM